MFVGKLMAHLLFGLSSTTLPLLGVVVLLPGVWSYGSHETGHAITPLPSRSIIVQAETLEIHNISRLSLSSERSFSWTDPNLQEALWADSPSLRVASRSVSETAQHALSRRIDPEAGYDVPIKGDQSLIKYRCLLCSKRGPENSIERLEVTPLDAEDYPVPRMIQLMQMDRQQRNKRSCVFYTQRRDEYKDLGSLSEAAEDWVYQRGCETTRSLWDMWEAQWRNDKKADVRCAVDEHNYYCLWHKEPNCCWLNGFFSNMKGTDIIDIRKREYLNTKYFERMSKAYALTCTGTVYLLSELKGEQLWKDPEFPRQRSIWWSHELPVLREKWYRNPKSIQLIQVEYEKDKVTGRELDITDEVFGRHPGLDGERRNPDGSRVTNDFAYEDTLDWTPTEMIGVSRLIGDLPHNMIDAGTRYFTNWTNSSIADSSSGMRLLSGLDVAEDESMTQRMTCNRNSNIEPKGEDWFG